MFSIPTPLLVTSITLLTSAIVCLLLEVAGVQESFKKTGSKPHIALLAFLSITAVAVYTLSISIPDSNLVFVFDKTAQLGIFFSCLMAIFCLILSIPQSRDSHQERGEKYALLLVLLLLVIVTCTLKDILYFTICVSQWTLIMMALAATDNYRHLGSEIAAKFFIKGSFLLLAMAAGIAFSYLCSGSTQFATIANTNSVVIYLDFTSYFFWNCSIFLVPHRLF
jgi:NADH:ubiquinone oxidoreductase subunit 2 (subunit N)